MEACAGVVHDARVLFSRRQFFQSLLAIPPVKAAVSDLEAVRELRPSLVRVTVPVRGLDRRLDGMRIGQILLPEICANICFGGPDMRTAYITLSDSGRLGVMQWPEPGLKLNFN